MSARALPNRTRFKKPTESRNASPQAQQAGAQSRAPYTPKRRCPEYDRFRERQQHALDRARSDNVPSDGETDQSAYHTADDQ